MKGLQSLIRKSTPSSFVYITERLGTAPFDKVLFEREVYLFLDEYVLKGIFYLLVSFLDG